MKWIGQHIYDLASRFRSDVFLEDISTGTIASGAHLGLDSNNKIVKAADGGGDLTGITVGRGLSGSNLTGPVPELELDFSAFLAVTPTNGDLLATIDSDGANEQLTGLDALATLYAGTGLTASSAVIGVDASQPTITTLAGLTSIGTTGAVGGTLNILSDDVTMYNPVNAGNPSFSIGANSNDRFATTVTYNSGAQTLDSVHFQTFTTSGSTNDGRYIWYVDEVELVKMLDVGILVSGGVSANDDGAYISTKNTSASSATEGGELSLVCDDGAAMADDHRLGVVEFQGAEDASSTYVTGARIQAMCDAAWSASENGTRLEFYTMDGNASSELSLTLDSDLLATFAGGVTVTGTITGDVTGDLTGEADTVATIAGLAPNTATTQATQAAITTCANLVTVGTIGTGVWNATAIASAKMATGTASAQGALELATTGEADTGTDTARAVTPAGLKSHVDANARKCILRHQPFYVNDNPMVQNSLYFGSSLGHQLGNWNDPQAAGGVIGDTASFTINKVDENWGMLLPFDISKVEVQCSLQPQLGTSDDFTVAIYTGIRGDDSAAALTLTLVAHNSISFSSSANRYVQNDVSVTADYAKGTMIYVGVGSEDATDAKNGRGYLTVTVTER